MSTTSTTPAAPVIDLPVITTPPASPHAHSHTVIFLHGRGDNTQSFTRALHAWHDSRGRTLFDTFPSFRWVFPQAPRRVVASSVRPGSGVGAGYPLEVVWPQWFDVWSTRDFSEREEIQAEGLREVVPLVRELIKREAEKLGGRWDRVVLAGISMGAATSVHTLFNLAVPAEGGGRLAAFLGFSGRCPFAGRGLQGMREVLGLEGVPEGDEVLRNTPMLLEHCVDDPLVLIDRGRGLRDTLRAFGAQVEWREYPSGGHWFQEPNGIDDVVDYVNKVVLGKTTAGAPGVTQQANSWDESDAMDLS